MFEKIKAEFETKQISQWIKLPAWLEKLAGVDHTFFATLFKQQWRN